MDLIEKNSNIFRHPWELSRSDSVIKDIIKDYKEGLILDIGCGDSYFDYRLLNSNIEIKKLYGIDINLPECFKKDNYIVVNNYNKLKNKKFDTIIMLDVLEHIENDKEFLEKNINELLDDNGRLIITIPTHQCLFSKHDTMLKHYRRYNIKMIKDLANKTGYKIINYHYFYLSLLIVRFLFRSAGGLGKWSMSPNNIITKTLRFLLNVDYFICKKLYKISNGLSLYVVLEKTKQ